MKRTDIPANIGILVPTDERVRALRPTTVLDIMDGGTNNFHENGLFSISTFGRVGSDERDTKFSFINLRTEIFHPYVFKCMVKLRGLYQEIMAGKAYAVWDEETHDFIASDPINGFTGYSFFFDKWRDIVFKQTGSDVRELRINFLTKFKEKATTTKILVQPAGLRDIQIDADGRIKEGEINAFYRSLISIANTINPGLETNPKILDNSRYSLQIAFMKIYDYIIGLLEGKHGFINGKWGARRIFNGTANVITAMDTSPAILGVESCPKINQTGIGLYQLMRGALPKTKHAILSGWLANVFNGNEGTANLINPVTLHRESVKVSGDTIDRWTTTSGIESVINSYKEIYPRLRPVIVEKRYVGLVYRGPGVFKLLSDIDDLPKELDKKDVHPLTLCELLYISGYRMWNTLGMFVTRYPITGIGSIYPSFAYVKNTVMGVARHELGHDWQPIGDDYIAYEYPDFDKQVFVDTLVPHTSRLGGMGGDFDGDKCSANVLYSDESAEELIRLLGKVNAYKGSRGNLMASPMVETVERALLNITGD